MIWYFPYAVCSLDLLTTSFVPVRLPPLWICKGLVHVVSEVDGPCTELSKKGHYILSTASAADRIQMERTQIQVDPSAFSGGCDPGLEGRIGFFTCGTEYQLSKDVKF